MNLEINDKKFVITNLDYDMLQVILNGLSCERNKLIDKITYLTTYLFKDYSETEKIQFRMQIDFLNKRNDELIKIVNDFNLQLETMPLFY
jgi:hypothetical protein